MDVIGRTVGEPNLNPRSGCKSVFQATYERGSFVGEIKVRFWESTDDEDRGGIVIELESDSKSGGFIPHAVNTPNGVQLHLAGSEEGASTLEALLVSAIKALPQMGRQAKA